MESHLAYHERRTKEIVRLELKYTLFIIDHSNIVPFGAVFLAKGLMCSVFEDIVVTILFGGKLDDEAVRKAAL